MQHIEFFHTDHFEKNYHRVFPAGKLARYIDFFWETDFDALWQQFPKGFSDALFPNTGYTYLINLGTPFTMQVGEKKFEMKTDGFLPRHKAIECFHQPGNKLFGIKFRVSPIVLEKKINFSEYRNYIFPLSYLVDPSIIDKVKRAASFDQRVRILVNYFQRITETDSMAWQPVKVVTEILEHCYRKNDFATPVAKYAAKYKVSVRTLQRYFETSTGISSKQAIQIMRIRKAVEQLAASPASFHYDQFGYYDHSHFYKHLKKFVQKKTLRNLKPHLKLLGLLHK